MDIVQLNYLWLLYFSLKCEKDVMNLSELILNDHFHLPGMDSHCEGSAECYKKHHNSGPLQIPYNQCFSVFYC